MTGDTAFDAALPTGRGLFAYTGVDGAAAAVDAIESDYAGHCRAAREIAAEFFAADKVLGGRDWHEDRPDRHVYHARPGPTTPAASSC